MQIPNFWFSYLTRNRSGLLQITHQSVLNHLFKIADFIDNKVAFSFYKNTIQYFTTIHQPSLPLH